jgi:single-strand DNA-binding protein
MKCSQRLHPGFSS